MLIKELIEKLLIRLLGQEREGLNFRREGNQLEKRREREERETLVTELRERGETN